MFYPRRTEVLTRWPFEADKDRMQFHKYHALGNDYLVLNPDVLPEMPTASQTVLICHRHYGLGSDGILYGPMKSERADFGLRIFNPDGSEAEKSGNGLRIFARYLYDCGRVGENVSFRIETPGGIVSCIVGEGAQKITVEMGQVSFNSRDIPVRGEAREVVDESIEVGGRTFKFCAATIGNPHCVLPLGAINEALARQYGPLLEVHEHFPNRTNVQFLKVLSRKAIQIEIWERGAGYTLASGSSSCAAAAVAHRIGACDEEIVVNMPGGQIEVNIAEGYAMTMSGPATRVGTYEMSDEVLSQTVALG